MNGQFKRLPDEPPEFTAWWEGGAYRQFGHGPKAAYLRAWMAGRDSTEREIERPRAELEPVVNGEGLPIIPPRLPAPSAPADGAVAICGACGLRVLPVMHYSCSRTDCPIFPVVTCATAT